MKDEEFPGIINMRIKLYKDAPPPKRNLFEIIGNVKKEMHVLRVYLYQAKDLPPADSTGTSDPFGSIRSKGKAEESSVRYKTLNPGWFEILDLEIEMYDLEFDKVPMPGFSILVYDDDVLGKKELLGRCRV